MSALKNEEHHVENFDLKDFIKGQRYQTFKERTESWSAFNDELKKSGEGMYMREVLTPMDREVTIKAAFENEPRKMLMFGSNNYLGLANHPYIKEKVKECMDVYGTGIGGPPLLNGYNILIKELETRLANLKEMEAALVYPSGYAANLGIFSSIATQKDIVLVDAQHHASCFDGLSLRRIPHRTFAHNDMNELKQLLEAWSTKAQDIFIAVEGVYSMSGDIAPLDQIVAIAKPYGAHIILDDAHGTGVMGPNGRGTAAHFDVENDIAINMGTFSKSFGNAGGFAAGKREIIEFLRYFSRSYMFSGSITPTTAAAVIAGIDIIEDHPDRHRHLRELISYASSLFNGLGFEMDIKSAIIALPVSCDRNIREMSRHFHQLGIFLNAIEYPAVPREKQCFRISLTASHTIQDINRLAGAVKEVYHEIGE